MTIPPLYGSLGRLVGSSLGWRIRKRSYRQGGVKGAAPLGLPPPPGGEGGSSS